MKTMALILVLLTAAGATLTLARAPAPLPRPKKLRRVPAGNNVTLELEGDRAQKRRVVVATTVCLREGELEHLLTRKGRKEHEAILTADVDARDIHKALLAAGATPGWPVRFNPNYTPASGRMIQISLEWQDKGKVKRVSAGEWVRDIKTKKAMSHDWVFAGSHLIADPQQPGRQIYLANDGDVICVANFEGALLDLAVPSSNAQAELAFEAFTERIPPLGTKVNLILEPALAPVK